MNYSKKNTVKKQQRINSTSRRLGTKAKVTTFRVFLACLIALIVVGISAGFGAVKGILDDAPDIDTINVAPTGFSSTVYDANGKKIQKLVGSDANRIYVELDKIPEVVQNAFIAIEDARFWTHNGIDIKGIFRAFFNGLKKGDFDSGASTLTQQLLKNQVFEGGREEEFVDKVKRKLQEQYLAIQLEEKLDKEQILEYYLNTINLGQNTLGVQAASLRYFNKSVSDLTLSEATVIAGITQNPSGYNPITYPEANAEKRQIILNYMEEQGYISAEEKAEAMADPVYDRILATNDAITSEQTTTINSYFVDAVIDQLIEDLQTKAGLSSTQAVNLIYRGGLSIYTTQDPDIQAICDEVISDSSYFPSNSVYELTYALSVQHEDGSETHYNEGHVKQFMVEKGLGTNLYFTKKDGANSILKKFKKAHVSDTDTVLGEKKTMVIQPQVSFTVMDQYTGEVKAVVGGRGKKEASRTLNRATDSPRQPGSTFKVVATYLPALDNCGLTLASVFDDAEHYYPNGKKVNNWETNKYRGLSTIRSAITASMNVVTVKTYEKVTPQLGYDYLMKLGFSTLVESETINGQVYSDINLSTALGGLTTGVTNVELTAAYAAIANGGYYSRPTFYTKVLDHDGRVLLEYEPEKNQVMKESTAWLLTSAMQDVVSAGTGTGKLARFQNKKMALAGKTGTTSNYIDVWFSGFTPYYTATIWGGYDNNVRQRDVNYHKIIWRTIMERIHKDLDYRDFSKPDNITTASICTKCGKLAVSGLCSAAAGGSCVKTEYFASGTKPTEPCDCHVKLTVCKETGQVATEYCPETETAVYLIKEETSTTSDTPYILNSKKEEPCTLHTEGWEPPTEPETETEGETNDPATETTTAPPDGGAGE